jgi:glycosyltransferase involved in cell wall biosynthesis
MSYMKIMHVIARMNKGGTARWIETLTIGLREQNHEVILLAGNVGENEEEDPSFMNLNGIRVDGLGRSISLIRDLKAIISVRKIIKTQSPQLINTHTAKAGVIGRIASLGLEVKVVHTFHGHLLYGYFSKPVTNLIIILERILSLMTDFYISVGEKVRDELVAAHIGNAFKFEVIYPGIKLSEVKSKEVVREKYSLNAHDFVVGWLGRLVPIKRPDILEEIANYLPEAKFLVGGSGESSKTLQTNAPKNIVFVGWVNPEEFWPACDIALLTSDNEGLPTSLVEAAQVGLPIVARNVGSVREVFEDNSGGFLFSDAKGAVQKISILIENKRIRDEFGINSQNYALLQFSQKKFIEKHVNLYKRIIQLS